jgi:hypothetical protein
LLNDPVYVYDTSGVYTDPSVKIDLRQGLSSVRSNWIEERDDTELLEGLSSDFANKQHAHTRELMRENTLTTDDLILPIGSQCQN